MKNKNSYCSVLAQLFLSFIIICSSQIQAEDKTPTAHSLINDMSRAVRTLNYDGTFIYRRGQQMDTMRLIHKSGKDGEQERLVSLTGSAREVIRNNKSVTCIFPDSEAVMVEKSRPEKLISNLFALPVEKVASHYKFLIVGKDRVAGRNTWVVDIKPNDVFRYGYQFWIDEDSRLLLKSELKNKSGFPLEQIMFTQLRILDSIPDELLTPSVSGANYTWFNGTEENKTLVNGDDKWKVNWMPNGFIMTNYEKQSIAASENMVNHLMFTDGLAMVSVFIEKIDRKQNMKLGPARMGGVNTFAKYINGYQVTAVGEVPQSTVQKMANSIVSE